MKKKLLLTLITGVFCALGASAGEPVAKGGADSTVPEQDCVIEPSEIVDIGSPVPGVVEKIHADRSDLVEAGAVVVELESSVERASHNLARSKAVLNTAIKLREESAAFGARTQKRNQALMKTSAISRHDMDQLESEARIAKLQVKQEKDNKRIAGLESARTRAVLDRRTIRSPVNGVVMERFKSTGEYIDDEPALRIAKLDPLHVEVIVPVRFLGQIRPGMQATVTPAAGNTEKRVATVERVDLVADAASSTYGVRLTLPNPDYQVTAGLRCLVKFQPGQNTVPAAGNARVAKAEPVQALPVSKPDKKTIPAVMKKPTRANKDSSGFVKVSSTKAKACYRIGPVQNERIAKDLSRKLEDKTQDLNLRHEEAMVIKDYVVMTPVTPGQKQVDAMLQRLLAAGIDDRFVFTKGRYKGRVSVGTYYYRQSAVKRQKLMASYGIDTEIVPRRKKGRQYWLDLKLQSGAEKTGKLETVHKMYAPSAPLKQVSCS